MAWSTSRFRLSIIGYTWYTTSGIDGLRFSLSNGLWFEGLRHGLLIGTACIFLELLPTISTCSLVELRQGANSIRAVAYS